MYKFARNGSEAKFGKQGELSRGFGSNHYMRSKVKDLLKNFYFEEHPQHPVIASMKKGKKSGEAFNSSFEK
jgi:hypothetical protein